MSKKKRIKKIFENAPIESADVNNKSTDSVPADAQSEETSSDTNPQEEVIEISIENEEVSREDSPVSSEPNTEITEPVPTNVQNEATPSDESLQEVMEASADREESPSEDSLNSEDAEEENSNEDLLDDVRRSLIEEEGDKGQKESKWWRRIGRKRKSAEPEKPSMPVEIDLPPVPASTALEAEQPLKDETEADVDQIDDLIDMLKAETEEVTVESTAAPEVETPAEPEPEIDFDELKKQAFRPRAEGEEEPEHFTDVRSVALEGGEEVLVEVETKPTDPMQDRISAFENALRPYRQYIYIALAFLGVAVAVVASLIIFNVYQRSRPASVAPVSNLPYPASVSLPGGWSFKLGRGTVQNGKWDPQGAEWLEGTEVCRWVALPWSRQLEAVVRTLNPKDPIELVMSNNDKFVYQVYSVRQLSPEEMQQLDSNSPCLLLILTQPDVEKRWVLTALP
jgi:hypothetical protein